MAEVSTWGKISHCGAASQWHPISHAELHQAVRSASIAEHIILTVCLSDLTQLAFALGGILVGYTISMQGQCPVAASQHWHASPVFAASGAFKMLVEK